MSELPQGADTLGALLRWRATERPETAALHRLDRDGSIAETRSYAQLDCEASAIAGELLERGCEGAPVLLLHPPGLAFVSAFFGCAYAGAVAIPACLPTRPPLAERVAAMRRSADPRLGLTAREALSRLESDAERAGLAGLPLLASDDCEGSEALEPHRDAASLASLQYTSGSLAAPRGVRISHAQILANLAAVRARGEYGGGTRMLSWLPHHHDMGLQMGILAPIFGAFQGLLMSPGHFAQRPARWLQAISRHRATTSGAPNFAFDLCARRVSEAELADLDLSSWDLAFVSAEPVQAESLERFARRFAESGFRRQAFVTAYGLAEATLAATVSPKARGPRVECFESDALEAGRGEPARDGSDSRRLVSAGPVLDGHEVVVVDPQRGLALDSGCIGEIWVQGPSIAEGYLGYAEGGCRFGLRLPGREEDFLGTGDLGFLHGGELFVTGRLSDLLIVDGRNLHPHDIEHAAALADPAVGVVAALPVSCEAGERVAAVVEVEESARGRAEELRRLIARAVWERMGITLEEVLLVPPGTVPRTTSGKIRRRACAEAHFAGARARRADG